MCGEDVVMQMPSQEDERYDVHGGVCACALLCCREDKTKVVTKSVSGETTRVRVRVRVRIASA